MDCENMNALATSFVFITIALALLGALGVMSTRAASMVKAEFSQSEQTNVEQDVVVEEDDVVSNEQANESISETVKPSLGLEPVNWSAVRNVVFAIIGIVTCIISGCIGIYNAFKSFCIAKVAFTDMLSESKKSTLIDMYTYSVNSAKYALAAELIGLSLILL